MRLLRHTGAPLLATLVAVGLGCPASDDTTNDDTTGPPATTTSTTSDDTTTTGTTQAPDDTTSTGADGTATEGSSSDEGNQGQACGNGAIEGTEQCDCGGDFCTPAGLNGAMCAGLVNPLFPNRVYTGGILDCNPASCQYLFTQCSFCGDTVLNGNEICELDDDPGPSCQALGMGSSTTPLPCGLNCQWDTTCCEMPLPKECL